MHPCSKSRQARPAIQARHAGRCGTAACPKRAPAPRPAHPVTVVPCRGALARPSVPSSAAGEPDRAIDTLNPVTVTEVTRPEVRPGWRGVRTQPAGPLVKQVACGTQMELKDSRCECTARSSNVQPPRALRRCLRNCPQCTHQHACAGPAPTRCTGRLPHSHQRHGTSRRHSQACPSRCCSNQPRSGSTCCCRAQGRHP